MKVTPAGAAAPGRLARASGRVSDASSVNADLPARAVRPRTVARSGANCTEAEMASTRRGRTGPSRLALASAAFPSSANEPGSRTRPVPRTFSSARPATFVPFGASACDSAARSRPPFTAKRARGSANPLTASCARNASPPTRARSSLTVKPSGSSFAAKARSCTPTTAPG